MDRRQVLSSLIALAAMPVDSLAQHVSRIGFLSSGGAAPESPNFAAFRRGMRDLNYVEGRNLHIEARAAGGSFERLPGLAAELVELNLQVIVADASPAIRAVRDATTTIPIVMGATGDPVGSGFVKSLAHPGGNVTGLSLLTNDVSGKLLDLLREVLPHLSRVGVLVSRTSSTYRAIVEDVEAAAKAAAIVVVPMEAQTPSEIESAFSAMSRSSVEALIVGVTPFFVLQQRQLVELASRYRLPSISGNREYAETGGLMSYGHDITANFRRAATYVDKLLKGAKPGELPVEQPMTFELVVNLKTARALGVAVPQSVLVRADHVIQ